MANPPSDEEGTQQHSITKQARHVKPEPIRVSPSDVVAGGCAAIAAGRFVVLCMR